MSQRGVEQLLEIVIGDLAGMQLTPLMTKEGVASTLYLVVGFLEARA